MSSCKGHTLLDQLQSPLFIRFYMHLHHMFVLMPRQLGFWPLHGRWAHTSRNIPAFTYWVELLLLPALISKRMLLTFLTSLPLFTPYPARFVLPTLLVETVVSRSSKIFFQFLPPMRPFHIHLISRQSSAAQAISHFNHRGFGQKPWKFSPINLQICRLHTCWTPVIQRLKIL